MHFLERLNKEALSSNLVKILHDFYVSYSQAAEDNGIERATLEPMLNRFLDCVLEQLAHPFPFEPFHQQITSPFDYYRFGLNFIRPLIILESSTVGGIAQVDLMERQLASGENVVLFANHQTEPDPQVISLLLEATHPKLAKEMIFVAGHRVVEDPLTVPFSMGVNLLCIYSKNYIDTPPEQKQEKMQHNQRTMKKMSQLLSEGGKCIYVAPSGGRDRPNAEGEIEVARFDPHSIEMFRLMAKKASSSTHFYPLALSSYALFPPPNQIKQQLGEVRRAQSTPVHLAFGKEIDMEDFPGSSLSDRKQRRQALADYAWGEVRSGYKKFTQ